MKAKRYARQLLHRLRLPAGAHPVPPAANLGGLPRPSLPVRTADAADVHRLYRVGEPFGLVAEFLRRNIPTGMNAAEAGQTARHGVVNAQFLNFAPLTLPRWAFDAQVAAAMSSAPGGGALLRVDAQVTWFPVRSAEEYIHPAGYQSVTVTIVVSDSDYVTRKFTSRVVIARLAAVLDATPAMPEFPTSCPAMSTAADRIVFTPQAVTQPKVIVTPDRCFRDVVVVGRRAQPPLVDRPEIITAIYHLLGLRAPTYP